MKLEASSNFKKLINRTPKYVPVNVRDFYPPYIYEL